MPGVEVMFWVFPFVCKGGFGLRGLCLFVFNSGLSEFLKTAKRDPVRMSRYSFHIAACQSEVQS